MPTIIFRLLLAEVNRELLDSTIQEERFKKTRRINFASKTQQFLESNFFNRKSQIVNRTS